MLGGALAVCNHNPSSLYRSVIAPTPEERRLLKLHDPCTAVTARSRLGRLGFGRLRLRTAFAARRGLLATPEEG
jgi:hypothetical protein